MALFERKENKNIFTLKRFRLGWWTLSELSTIIPNLCIKDNKSSFLKIRLPATCVKKNIKLNPSVPLHEILKFFFSLKNLLNNSTLICGHYKISYNKYDIKSFFGEICTTLLFVFSLNLLPFLSHKYI